MCITPQLSLPVMRNWRSFKHYTARNIRLKCYPINERFYESNQKSIYLGSDMQVFLFCRKVNMFILGCLFFCYTSIVFTQENFNPVNLEVKIQIVSDGSPIVNSPISTARYVNFPHSHLGFTDSNGKITIKFREAYGLQQNKLLPDNNMLLWIKSVDSELFYGIPLQPVFSNNKCIINIPKLTKTKVQIKPSDNDVDFASFIFIFWKFTNNNCFISQNSCESDGVLFVHTPGQENCNYMILKKDTSSGDGDYFCTKILEYQFLQKDINIENFDFRFSLPQGMNCNSLKISPGRYHSDGTLLSPYFELNDIGFRLQIMLDFMINPTIKNNDHHLLFGTCENILGIQTFFSDGKSSHIEYDFSIN